MYFLQVMFRGHSRTPRTPLTRKSRSHLALTPESLLFVLEVQACGDNLVRARAFIWLGAYRGFVV